MESKNSQLEKTEKNRTKILKKLLGSKIVSVSYTHLTLPTKLEV